MRWHDEAKIKIRITLSDFFSVQKKPFLPPQPPGCRSPGAYLSYSYAAAELPPLLLASMKKNHEVVYSVPSSGHPGSGFGSSPDAHLDARPQSYLIQEPARAPSGRPPPVVPQEGRGGAALPARAACTYARAARPVCAGQPAASDLKHVPDADLGTVQRTQTPLSPGFAPCRSGRRWVVSIAVRLATACPSQLRTCPWKESSESAIRLRGEPVRAIRDGGAPVQSSREPGRNPGDGTEITAKRSASRFRRSCR